MRQYWEYLHLTASNAGLSNGSNRINYINGKLITEYRELFNYLNELGSQGWELVQVICQPVGTELNSLKGPIYILKRAK